MIDEAQRLHTGPKPGETPTGVVSSFTLLCEGNAGEVVSRCREAMRSVLSANVDPWPSDEEWERILPKWFVDACFPEITQEEAERRRKLPMAEQERLADEWSVGAWAYWFQPSERSWYWWDAKVLNGNQAQIRVVSDSLPFAMGALKWLCKAAGARRVIEPDAMT